MAGYYFWARFTFPVHVVTNHWSQYSEVPLHKFCWTTFSPREKKLNQITWHWSYAHMVHTLFAPFHICLKVDQHSVLNGLNHEDSAIKWQIYILRVKKWQNKYMLTYSFFCYCTSTEGTYHRQFRKFAQVSMSHTWAKILLCLSNKTFQVLTYEKIHLILCN